MAQQMAMFGDDRIKHNDDGSFSVASKSHKGTWHHITADGKCDCLGYLSRATCWHVKLLREQGHLALEPVVISRDALPPIHWADPKTDDSPVWTTRYQNGSAILAHDMVAVRITVGKPRFKLPYSLNERIDALAPTGGLFGINHYPKFKEAFYRHLDQTGPMVILDMLQDVIDRNGGRRIALLCYEDVAQPGEWCHRLVVSMYMQDRLGFMIPEMAPM